jgi:pyrroline-5-carboxylate reductase
MGGALLDGWLERGTASSVHVVEPAAPARFADRPGVALHAAAGELPQGLAPDVVVFAVKPQVMAEVVPAYRRFVSPATVFLSIAAGKTLRFFAGHLGEHAAVVRAMPNTPAAVGRGISVCCAGRAVSRGQRDLCDALLEAVGEVGWVEDEALIDAVTAVSGSGPAYVFHLVEALAEAGEAAGLPAELAMRLARATVIGAGELLRLSPESAATLRENVTSPKGTTYAALQVLMADDGLPALMRKAVAAAADRSRELAD